MRVAIRRRPSDVKQKHLTYETRAGETKQVIWVEVMETNAYTPCLTKVGQSSKDLSSLAQVYLDGGSLSVAMPYRELDGGETLMIRSPNSQRTSDQIVTYRR